MTRFLMARDLRGIDWINHRPITEYQLAIKAYVAKHPGTVQGVVRRRVSGRWSRCFSTS